MCSNEKNNFFLLVLLCAVVVILDVVDRTFAERGREYYEQTGSIIWDIQTKEKVVALTFDDGPHGIYTEQILDALQQYSAKGTFFLVGQLAEENPQVVRRMYEEGHEIANHTYTHPSTKSVTKIMKEIEQTNDAIFSITGFTPKLFRPVEGYYTDAIVDEVVKAGYTIVMWSWHQDTEDWKDPGVDRIVNKVLKGIKAGDNILFHDGGGNREQTVQALEKLLPQLEKDGYKFITVSEMIQLKNKQVNSNEGR